MLGNLSLCWGVGIALLQWLGPSFGVNASERVFLSALGVYWILVASILTLTRISEEPGDARQSKDFAQWSSASWCGLVFLLWHGPFEPRFFVLLLCGSGPLLAGGYLGEKRMTKKGLMEGLFGVGLVVAFLGIILVPGELDRRSKAESQAREDAAPTLQQAILSGQVVASFRGTGASSGQSVMVELSRGPNAPRDRSWVVIPAGSRLESSGSGFQDMMVLGVHGWLNRGSRVVRKRTMLIPTRGSATYPLDAFCVDFHENNPSATTSFTLRSPDSTLECISSGSMASELPIAATQAAVWMYTDRVTFDEMASHFSVSPNNWNAGLKVAAACGVIAGR